MCVLAKAYVEITPLIQTSSMGTAKSSYLGEAVLLALARITFGIVVHIHITVETTRLHEPC